jgi:hypothetical protein
MARLRQARRARLRLVRHGRCKVDDGAAAPLLHHRPHRLASDEDDIDLQLHGVAEIRQADVLDQTPGRVGTCIDQDVNAARAGLRARHPLPDLRLLGQVHSGHARQGEPCGLGLRGGHLNGRLVDVGGKNVCALSRKEQGTTLPDARPSPGDQGHLAFQPLGGFRLPRRGLERSLCS